MGAKRGNGAGCGIRIIHYGPSRMDGTQPGPGWLNGLVSDLITCWGREQTTEALAQQATCALIVSYGVDEAAIDIHELESFHEIQSGLRIIALVDPSLADAPGIAEAVRRMLVY